MSYSPTAGSEIENTESEANPPESIAGIFFPIYDDDRRSDDDDEQVRSEIENTESEDNPPESIAEELEDFGMFFTIYDDDRRSDVDDEQVRRDLRGESKGVSSFVPKKIPQRLGMTNPKQRERFSEIATMRSTPSRSDRRKFQIL